MPLKFAALRQRSNSSTCFSPAKLVYAENIRGTLDLRYWGWIAKKIMGEYG